MQSSKSRRALIIGANGQDGTCLRELLIGSGYEVWSASAKELWKEGEFSKKPFSVLDVNSLKKFFSDNPPAELYYLAAYHHSSQERSLATEEELWAKSLQVNVQGWVNCLAAMAAHAPKSHAVYAASSHVFGRPTQIPQTETTPFAPINVYGISKVAGIHAARFYRQSHSIRASCALFYNHESPLRTEKFVSQKIIRSLQRIKAGVQDELVLGDLQAVVDWGYAPDFVRALQQIAQLDEGDDFVVATGQVHTVKDFVQLVCLALDLDLQKVVREDPSVLGRSYQRLTLIGDSSKLRQKTGWRPTVSFQEMVQILLLADAQSEVNR